MFLADSLSLASYCVRFSFWNLTLSIFRVRLDFLSPLVASYPRELLRSSGLLVVSLLVALGLFKVHLEFAVSLRISVFHVDLNFETVLNHAPVGPFSSFKFLLEILQDPP